MSEWTSERGDKAEKGLVKTLFWNEISPSVILSGMPIGRDERAIYFLHGVCGVFAIALYDLFGYQIEVAAEENVVGSSWEDRLVHVYCRDDNQNLVDVRGVIDDEDLFLEDFEDFFDPRHGEFFELPASDLRSFLNSCMSSEDLDWLYAAATKLIHDNIQGYKV